VQFRHQRREDQPIPVGMRHERGQRFGGA
jgi:hypothetical protein